MVRKDNKGLFLCIFSNLVEGVTQIRVVLVLELVVHCCADWRDEVTLHVVHAYFE